MPQLPPIESATNKTHEVICCSFQQWTVPRTDSRGDRRLGGNLVDQRSATAAYGQARRAASARASPVLGCHATVAAMSS